MRVYEDLNVWWGEIVSFVKSRTDGMSRSDTKEYLDFIALYVGVSRKSIDRWIEDSIPETVMKQGKVVSHIERLYRYVQQAEHGNWRLAEAVAKSLHLTGDDFGPLKKYSGSYKVFRLGKDGLIVGDLTITNFGGVEPWMHYHRSTQDDIDYDHQGPIYHVNGRIYMLGVGSNDREKYFRPMIFKARDLPEKSVTFGIVLTELADSYIPLSAKVALVSEKDVRLADPSKKEGFLADLADRLRIDSETNVIYGAEANKP